MENKWKKTWDPVIPMNRKGVDFESSDISCMHVAKCSTRKLAVTSSFLEAKLYACLFEISNKL